MPTYEYRCDACGHEMEAFQSITADPLKKCPACGKSQLRRLIGTGAGVVFKGSGFWQTDYRSESYKKGEKAAKEATEGKKKDGDKKETKSEAAKPGKTAAEKKSES